MIITANITRLRVDFRMPGKFYTPQVGEQEPTPETNTTSNYPFDSKDLEIGEAVTLPDEVTFLRVVAYTPDANHGEAPAGE